MQVRILSIPSLQIHHQDPIGSIPCDLEPKISSRKEAALHIHMKANVRLLSGPAARRIDRPASVPRLRGIVPCYRYHVLLQAPLSSCKLLQLSTRTISAGSQPACGEGESECVDSVKRRGRVRMRDMASRQLLSYTPSGS